MKPFIKAATLLSLFTILISFNSNPLEEPIPPEETVLPGRRDYVWKEYVLETPQYERAFVNSIWGSSPNNIWTVGSGSLSQLGIWHFDGTKWKNFIDDPTLPTQPNNNN